MEVALAFKGEWGKKKRRWRVHSGKSRVSEARRKQSLKRHVGETGRTRARHSI